MTEYEVGVRAFTHVTVEADDIEDVIEKAREKADVPRGWDVDSYDPVRIGGDDE